MKVKALGHYDYIIIWGIGRQFRTYFKNQFKVDFLIDRNGGGKMVSGIPTLYPMNLPDICNKGKTLIVVSSDKYYEDIIADIKEMALDCETVRLIDLLAVYGTENKSFCCWGVDALAKDILQRSGYPISDMSYIEVGANHPIHGSATEAFYLLGARGILIEPNPDCMSVLQELRPEDKCLNCGIGKEKGTMKFYRFADNSYRNSFDWGEVKKNIARGYKLQDEIEIPIISINDVIEKYNVDTSKTFLSIQVMGSEWEFLEGFSYNNYDFPVISIAYYDDKVLEHSIFRDYKEIARVPKHIILVKQEIYDKIYN
ncbi:MAG: FkbM family methyltransferase [Eubacterium sp.]|nr:FkbM family methyltransferase [Eubacterium sp.]